MILVATAFRQPLSIANIPISSWLFAIRIWLATILALFVSFWLQLEAPSTAALTIAVLAEPTRGQALEKAGFRSFATIVGVTASIVVTGLFSQTELILAAFAVWLGICVFAAKLLDGNRAYAAALSGYTVGLIATQQIDHPQHVFEVGMARGVAIAVGILSMAVVNDLLFAPDHYPRLALQLAALHHRIRAYATAALNREPGVASKTFLALVRDILALRPAMTSVGLDSGSSLARSAAARSAIVALVAELLAARIEKIAQVDVATRDQTSVAFGGGRHSGLGARLPAQVADARHEPGVGSEGSAWTTRELLRRDEEVQENLLALRSARWPLRSWRAPLYRSYRIAAENGVRASLWIAIASAFFVCTGWPATSVSLSFVMLIGALGATTANPRGFTAMALVGAPIAAVLAGMLKFVILDGVDGFPSLTIAMAPFMVGAALLMTSRNLLWSSLGRVNLAFITIFVAPSNPQTYNPQTFLFTFVFIVAAAGLLLVAQTLIPPVSDHKRRMRLATTARGDLQQPQRLNRHSPEEAMFRDTSRLEQFLSSGGAQDSAALADMLSCFDQSAMLLLCKAKLTQLADAPLAPLAHRARAAIVTRDTGTLRAVAGEMRENASPTSPIEADVAACLFVACDLLERGRIEPFREVS
ncbi:FUSC family protein [Rhizobium leguminosarum]